MIRKNVIWNTIMLYGLSFAKIIFPLMTLPYLTRTLSTEVYGVVSYVKATMQYMQIAVDFGFMLSGTKEIVRARENHGDVGKEAGNILLARLLLAACTFMVLILLMTAIPLLRANVLYTLLAFCTVFLSVFLFDYLFRGLEKMQIITIRFVLMRAISTLMTFVLVKGDADYLWIPVLDIIGSLAAILLVFGQIRKLNIRIRITSLNDALHQLKNSAIYFASNMATTAFGALNTMLIGIYLSADQVAYWGVSMQLIGAVQTLYNPITDGIYPEMIKSKDLSLVKNVLKIFMPVILTGCVFSFAFAEPILTIVSGVKYIAAVPVFRYLIPLLFISFPAMVLGWPTLGPIGKEKQVTATTIFTAVFQVLGLVLLGMTHNFTLITLAVLRCLTEMVLFGSRLYFCVKYRNEYAETGQEA